MDTKTKKGYTPRATIFSSRNDTEDATYLRDAVVVAEGISRAGFGVNNGGSATGLMGTVAKTVYENNGSMYGIALADYEPLPNQHLTEYEGYTHHYERQRRLIELGDIYIALPGAVGTFHEVLEVHILNILGEINKPIILVGAYFARYRNLIESFAQEGLMHTDKTTLYYARDGYEAAAIAVAYLTNLVRKEYVPPIYYPALNTTAIYTHISQNTNPYRILFEGLCMTVFPNVYPSNRFRSSRLFAKLVRALSMGKKIADIACGHGAMGLVALDAGATEVVMSDLNTTAVENARYNLRGSPHKTKGVVFESDLFERIPSIYKHHFDIIFFNPPFHAETVAKTQTPLAYAFKTQRKEASILVRFLQSAKEYLALGGVLYVGFSNKDTENLSLLEAAMHEHGYVFELVVLENSNTVADNRIYKVTPK